MDPLSDVLAALSIRTGSLSGIDAAGPWGLRFGVHEHVKIGAVLAGSCWIGADGGAALPLTAGDCFLLAVQDSFEMSDEVGTPLADSGPVFQASADRVVRLGGDTPAGGGGRTFVIGGSVHFLDGTVAHLLDGLPPLTVIRAGTGPARAIQPLLRLCLDEVEAARLGTPVMIGRLTEMLFVQAMRALVEEEPGGMPLRGWLGALSDAQIGAALLLMHRDPARRWTVAALGGAVGMSRAGFAARFRQLVGMPPLDYLQRWRVLTAGRALLSGDRTVASVAAEWGYSSEAAFSAAFKRITGVSPGRYRADPLAAAPPLRGAVEPPERFLGPPAAAGPRRSRRFRGRVIVPARRPARPKPVGRSARPPAPRRPAAAEPPLTARHLPGHTSGPPAACPPYGVDD
ncbi:transcriptional regulator, AraC family [Streptomyces sp. DvalAA-14]|nr:AraC family transcriptional regulator [Streptomyces sp. SID4948]MYS25182.1 helix-turn-helix domain-containing protein [Streptomyces sp. SID4948]SCE52767.1 transcriptional regulator, AraC family [Streptomyces sp. DvalAA-14]